MIAGVLEVEGQEYESNEKLVLFRTERKVQFGGLSFIRRRFGEGRKEGLSGFLVNVQRLSKLYEGA